MLADVRTRGKSVACLLLAHSLTPARPINDPPGKKAPGLVTSSSGSTLSRIGQEKLLVHSEPNKTRLPATFEIHEGPCFSSSLTQLSSYLRGSRIPPSRFSRVSCVSLQCWRNWNNDSLDSKADAGFPLPFACRDI